MARQNIRNSQKRIDTYMIPILSTTQPLAIRGRSVTSGELVLTSYYYYEMIFKNMCYELWAKNPARVCWALLYCSLRHTRTYWRRKRQPLSDFEFFGGKTD